MAAPPAPPPLNPFHTPAGDPCTKPSSPFSESERECFLGSEMLSRLQILYNTWQKKKSVVVVVVGEGWRWDTQRLRGEQAGCDE